MVTLFRKCSFSAAISRVRTLPPTWRWMPTEVCLYLPLYPCTVLTCIADNFTTLGDLIVSFPRINHYSHFLFVPGPNDPWSSDLLPRRPIPSTFTQRLSNKIAHAVFGSNPCRIKFMGQEIVVFREDLMAKMVRNLVGVKPDLESADLKRYVRFLESLILSMRQSLILLSSSFRPFWIRLTCPRFHWPCRPRFGNTITRYGFILCRQR